MHRKRGGAYGCYQSRRDDASSRFNSYELRLFKVTFNLHYRDRLKVSQRLGAAWDSQPCRPCRVRESFKKHGSRDYSRGGKENQLLTINAWKSDKQSDQELAPHSLPRLKAHSIAERVTWRKQQDQPHCSLFRSPFKL